MKKLAYAKINLFLNVKSKREDGFHELEMVNITVGLADVLTLELTDKELVVETSDPSLNGRNNLAFKAAEYLKKVFHIEKGVRIYIEKNIPAGGGLAGGSSDAAATIEALNELWDLNLDDNQMFDICKNFGSDTPYCFYKGPAVVKGVGFDIEPIDLDITQYEISLFSPKINVSTGTVFSNLKNNNKYSLDDSIKKLTSNDYDTFVEGLKNDLEETVFDLYPEVKKEYELLSRVYGNKGLFMTGSGSTIVRISKKQS